MAPRFQITSPSSMLVVGLTILPMLYMGLWSTMIIGTFSGLWHPHIAGLDVGTAIRRADPAELAGFVLMSSFWLSGIAFLVSGRRAAVYCLILGCAVHIAVWLKITDGQYYAGQFGLIIILLEMLAITLAHFITRGRRLI